MDPDFNSKLFTTYYVQSYIEFPIWIAEFGYFVPPGFLLQMKKLKLANFYNPKLDLPTLILLSVFLFINILNEIHYNQEYNQFSGFNNCTDLLDYIKGRRSSSPPSFYRILIFHF